MAVALERLAASRAELRAAFGPAFANDGDAASPRPADAGIVQAVLANWWRHQPWRQTATLAADALLVMIKPVARNHPLRLMAGAALAGGLLAATRPWRWLARPALLAVWPMLRVAATQALACVAAHGGQAPPVNRGLPTTPHSSSGPAG